jgi:site-specific DNA-methyltransferase (adenine-specific)
VKWCSYIHCEKANVPSPFHVSDSGVLFSGDCLDILPYVKDNVVDTVFADPPFNLGKTYGKHTNDLRSDDAYVKWCQDWLAECVRILKPGGSIFIYNLPQWNILLGAFLLEQGLWFRHWIAVAISACMPIFGKLHPTHYSILYYSKGKPKTFRRIRTPIETCRHCGGEIKDYGGHRKAMSPNGVTLKDVWTDITPVRHRKFKSEKYQANVLSTKMLERIVEMSTVAGDVILDPFGGSGTTYVVCEVKARYWLGIDIDSCPQIVQRLGSDDIHMHISTDFVENTTT